MSRLPPVPPASKPIHGPDGVAKTSVDISHRIRHHVDRAAMAGGDRDEVGRDASPLRSEVGWTLVAAAAALGLGYWAGRQAA